MDFSNRDNRYVGLENLEQNVGIKGYSNTENIKSLKNVFHAGEILYGKLRPYLDKHGLAEWDGVCSTDILVFQVMPVTISKYINYFLDTDALIKFAIENSKGINLPRVSETTLVTIPCPLPPFPEQQRIVDRIESLFSKLDKAKDIVQNALDSFETRKMAILYKAFTGELTEKWRKEHGVDLNSWERKTLQSVCSMKITDGTHKTPTYCEASNGIPFLSSKDVTSEKICWDDIKYIVPELHEELYTRLAPQVGDVLLAKNGTTGVAAIVDEKKIFDVYVTLAVLRPNKDIIMPKYLLNIVNSPICKDQFNKHLTGIGLPNLHLRDIKAVIISVPLLKEQAEIIKILDNLLPKEKQTSAELYSMIKKIDLMKKAILARAFRGELGTNDPNEESAMEQLNLCIKNESK